MAALCWICDLVEAHVPSWSPDIRHDCAMASPHCHGSSSPHSHMLKWMCRPVALRALLMSGYVVRGSMSPWLHQSICGQNQGICQDGMAWHGTQRAASPLQWRLTDVAGGCISHLDPVYAPFGVGFGILHPVPVRPRAVADARVVASTCTRSSTAGNQHRSPLVVRPCVSLQYWQGRPNIKCICPSLHV